MNINIKRSTLKNMIPKRSREMKEEIKNNGTDKYVGKSKLI